MQQISAPAAEGGLVGPAKAATVWAGAWLGHLGIGSWGDAAAAAAFVYSLLLIAGWIGRRVTRWRAGRVIDAEDSARGDLS